MILQQATSAMIILLVVERFLYMGEKDRKTLNSTVRVFLFLRGMRTALEHDERCEKGV